MGFFSWKTSDTNRSISNAHSKRGTFNVYVLCPDGTAIPEGNYDGYGVFGGFDIYELVAIWNRDNLTADYLKKPAREHYGWGSFGDDAYNMAISRYKRDCKMLEDYMSGKSDSFMSDNYGKDWLSVIGIMIACYDHQNAAIKYPIKIVENPNLKYDEVEPSVSCPNQGYFYGGYYD